MPDRVAAGRLPHGPPNLAAPGLCRRLRLRQGLRSDARGGWSREKNHGAFQTDNSVECFAEGSPSWIHKLGAVRGESAADPGECPHEEAYRSQVGPWWSRAPYRSRPVRALRSDNAGLLWIKFRPPP